MRRRWVLAFGASVIAHVLVAGVIAGQFQRQPIEIEIATTRLDEIHDLPLGPPPPPPAPTHEKAQPRTPPHRRAPSPPVTEHDGELSRATPSPAANQGPIAEVDAGRVTPPSANGLRGYGPEGSRVTLLLRFDRLRATAYTPAVDALLASTADRRDLLAGTGLDLFHDLDALLIATPDPRDGTATFLAGRHRLTDADLRAALERGASATGRVLTWRTEEDRPFAERQVRPFDPNAAVFSSAMLPGAARDDRIVVLPAPGLVVVTPPIYKTLLLGGDRPDGGRAAEAADAGSDADGSPPAGVERWAALLQRIDAQDGSMPSDAVAMLTAVDMFAARGPEPTAIAGLAPPRILTASVGLTPTPWVDIRADLETEAQARAWEAAWPTLHQRLSTNPIVRITGLGALLAHAELERVDAQIHVHETATETEAIRFLQLTTRLLRTAAVVRQ